VQHRHPISLKSQIPAFIILLACLSASFSTSASEQATGIEASTDTMLSENRPKIGLVLSGGGARGFAHIGVLKVLEQHNVPIDFIAGTSMGSIIGGLYAIGMSPDEIEQGVQGIDWANVFNDIPDRDYRYVRRKQDNEDFFSLQRIGINEDGLQITPGLIEGQQIELALDRLAYPGFHIHDFDQLHIPYRAIATDIETGKPVVIRSGNLARAMRASMSIPGALPPIQIDDKLLVDGGIANNVPVDVVREMGADIVIVVDVSAPLDKKEDLKSSFAITGQLTTIMTRRIADQQIENLEDYDVLIVPGARDITSSDFIEYPVLIEAGYNAANLKLDDLELLSMSAKAYSQYRGGLKEIAIRSPVINAIRISNKTSLRDEVLLSRIRQKAGEPLDIAQLEQDLAYIYGLDYSSSVVYDIEQNDEGHTLVVYVRGREWATSYIELGLSIESTFESNSITNFNASYTDNNFNDLGGELRIVAALGSEPLLRGEYYQPLNTRLSTFFSLRGGHETQVVPILIDQHIESVQRINTNMAEIALGQTFAHNTVLKLGAGYRDGHFSSIAGLKAAQPDFIESYYHIELLHDSLDNLSFPNKGLFGGINVEMNREDIGADRAFDQIRTNLAGATSFGRYTVFARAVAETTSEENQLPLNGYLINGGFLNLSGTVRNELLSPHFALLETAFYRRLGNITFLPIYSGFSVEAGNAWQKKDDISENNLRYAGSVFVGADTFLGPLYLAYGQTSKGESAIYLYIGNSFL